MLREKTALRQDMKNRLALIPEQQFAAAGQKAAQLIPQSPLWKQFETILLFMPIKGEINTLPLMQAALCEDKKLYLPRIEHNREKQKSVMCFYRVTSKDLMALDIGGISFQDPFFPNNKDSITWNLGHWNTGSFGIMEPEQKDPLESTDFPALILTPGLAFDRQGGRLGRGKGYYDRFFAELNGLVYKTAGLCMETQVVERVPTEQWDRKMDYIFDL